MYKILVNTTFYIDQALRKCRYFPTPLLHAFDYATSSVIKFVYKRIGYPSVAGIGEDGVERFNVLLAHSPDFEFIEQCVLDATREGSTDIIGLTRLIDKLLVKRGEKQIWGNIVETKKEADGWITKPMPLRYPDKVDSLRKNVGVEPLAEYLEEAEKMFIKIYRKRDV